MSETLSPPDSVVRERTAWWLPAWSVIAAFGAYFCMYGFRKPFTAAAFSDEALWGTGEKSVLVTAQVLGYMAAKFLGIRVIAEMPANLRARGILVLIAAAELALLFFGIVPRPLHVFFLFANGLALGMVYGLVVGFLEGRRNTEALTAGLCASFILADGLTKSVGTWILGLGITERWMPAVAGLLFLPPLLVFVWMLTRILPPNEHDITHRSKRVPIDKQTRVEWLSRYGVGLAGILGAYFFITIARSLRADFAPEIWRGLGLSAVPSTFANSEILVAIGILAVNGAMIFIVDNRRAFLAALCVSLSGALLMMFALAGLKLGAIGAFPYMVLIGVGLYLPYVAVHTTIFERLIAMTRDRGNLGFLMYVADSVGYLGYALLMIGKGFFPSQNAFLPFFEVLCWVIAILTCICMILSFMYFLFYMKPRNREDVLT